MEVLIADDDALSRRILQDVLVTWGYQVKVTKNGHEAWEALQREDTPSLAILDWMVLKYVNYCASRPKIATPTLSCLLAVIDQKTLYKVWKREPMIIL